jgi:hypothetical protein
MGMLHALHHIVVNLQTNSDYRFRVRLGEGAQEARFERVTAD